MTPETQASEPIVSIVITSHNNERTIEAALQSALNQTYPSVEVIAVDDSSTDTTKDILMSLADGDERLSVITLETNDGAAIARKHGVDRATGRYLMFLDGDDLLSEKACEILVGLAETGPADILHFNADVIPKPDIPAAATENMYRFMAPRDERLDGDQVFEAFFVRHQLNWNLWNKFYDTGLCKRAFSHISRQGIHRANDIYCFFFMTLEAQSYRSVDTPPLYHYFFGTGSSGKTHESLSSYLRLLTSSITFDEIRSYLDQNGLMEKYETSWCNMRNELLLECIQRYERDIADEDKDTAAAALCESWGARDVIDFVQTHGDTAQVAIAQAKDDASREENALKDQLSSCEDRLTEALGRAAEYEDSNSWKIGRALTWLPRTIKGLSRKH